jgi:hypothetical protein
VESHEVPGGVRVGLAAGLLSDFEKAMLNMMKKTRENLNTFCLKLVQNVFNLKYITSAL